jgi:hypothetical protein
MHLVSLGDRRKAQDLPTFLRKDVTDEVVFVQPLHDDHDGAMALVDEANGSTPKCALVAAKSPGIWECRLEGYHSCNFKITTSSRFSLNPMLSASGR